MAEVWQPCILCSHQWCHAIGGAATSARGGSYGLRNLRTGRMARPTGDYEHTPTARQQQLPSMHGCSAPLPCSVQLVSVSHLLLWPCRKTWLSKLRDSLRCLHFKWLKFGNLVSFVHSSGVMPLVVLLSCPGSSRWALETCNRAAPSVGRSSTSAC